MAGIMEDEARDVKEMVLDQVTDPEGWDKAQATQKSQYARQLERDELKEARRLVTILSILSGVAALALLAMYFYVYKGG